MRGYIDMEASVERDARLLFRVGLGSGSEKEVPPFRRARVRNPIGRPGTASFPKSIGDLPGLALQAFGLNYSIPVQRQ